MSLRTRKVRTVVDLSPECHDALVKLEEDAETLTELLTEMLATQRAVLDLLRGEVETVVANGGVPHDLPDEEEQPADLPDVKPYPGVQVTPGDVTIRDSPFTRAPRRVQIEWLKEVMADGEWRSSLEIADRYAVDERHRRYMRSAVGGRMRELFEDGEAERRASTRRGVMFEYRLTPTT